MTDPKEKTRATHTVLDTSQDKKRNEEEVRHHPASSPQPHPAHHPQKQPTGSPRHHPHTPPKGQDLNTDHGTHEDRPVPGKIIKKGKQPGV